jgi:FAS-associated factor 2
MEWYVLYSFYIVLAEEDCLIASQKLQATTYPFVAFVALQPRRMGQSSQRSVLTVLSRHQGPSIPASSAPTSAQTLVSHLNDQLLPRVLPYLTNLRSQAAERETARLYEQHQREKERALRAEQDRAFEETARRDKERIERKIAEEREEQQAALRQAEEERRMIEEQQKSAEENAQWQAKRMEWRRWGRKTLLPREPRPGEQGRGKTVRVGVRMPNGQRSVRFFGEADSLTAVYAFVDAQFIPEGKEFSSSSDPVCAPEGEEPGEIGLLHAMEKVGKKNGDWWGFKLATVYPRREIHWEPNRKVGEVEGLSGGQLVVELLEDPSNNSKRKGKAQSRSSSEGSRPGSNGAASPPAGDSDEYETESD